MNKFGKRSRDNLDSADSRWTEVMEIVIQIVDCSILEGHRGERRQNILFHEGKSKIKWPDGEHNKLPSGAIDAVPYPIDWDDIERMRAFAFFVKGVAAGLGYNVRLGADWNGNFTNKDQTFHDLPHMEFAD
jgi:peptidoglycan L-alanyl-D-glutamate endopeptidase CwlK